MCEDEYGICKEDKGGKDLAAFLKVVKSMF
jgi:hypothetical protein